MDFNAAAAGWDTDRRIKRAETISDEIAKSIHIKPNSNALEFGCGTGLISFGLRGRFDHITLVDNSKAMINTLVKKIDEAGIANMTVLNADILSMAGSGRDTVQKALPEHTALPKRKYDVVYTSMALHHVVDVGSALDALYGLLCDGGTICIVDLTQDDGSFHRLEKDFTGHNGFKQDELKAALEDKGFVDVHSRVFFEDIKRIEERDVPYSLFIMTGSKPVGRDEK